MHFPKHCKVEFETEGLKDLLSPNIVNEVNDFP